MTSYIVTDNTTTWLILATTKAKAIQYCADTISPLRDYKVIRSTKHIQSVFETHCAVSGHLILTDKRNSIGVEHVDT